MSSAAAGTPKWPGDHAEKHRQAALLGWARKRGFTRDTVKRGRRKSEPAPPKAPPSRGMELARQVQVSAQRTRPAAHPDYSPHAGNVARLTLMHELGMERDAAKRAKIRRELRKLGVPSDQIPKEPRKPRAPREGSAAVSQPKAQRDARYEQWKQDYNEAGRELARAVAAGDFNGQHAALTRRFKLEDAHRGYAARYHRSGDADAFNREMGIGKYSDYATRGKRGERVTFDQEPRTDRSAAVSQPKPATDAAKVRAQLDKARERERQLNRDLEEYKTALANWNRDREAFLATGGQSGKFRGLPRESAAVRAWSQLRATQTRIHKLEAQLAESGGGAS